MTFRFCDDRGNQGFSWLAVEPQTRTSHALAADGRVWLVDPVDWDVALGRALSLGQPAAVLQLLDRHNRDSAALAARVGVPHLTVPASVPESPFRVIELIRRRFWQEVALWWPEAQTLVVSESIGTNPFFANGADSAGVHLALRLWPPRAALEAFVPKHLLVGHGEGLHGPDAAEGLRHALADARTGLPRALLGLPGLLLRARRQGD